tara:strand:- start:1315 stop:1608 length:294 start_codon:yes stop_codon:yes gene_type:complete
VGGAAGLLPPPGKAGLRGLFFKLVVRMFWVIGRKDCFHLKLLAIVNKEADFEFITAMVTARQTEAVEAHMFAASGFQDYWLVFITVAALVCENIKLH